MGIIYKFQTQNKKDNKNKKDHQYNKKIGFIL